ncbi:MAG: putative phage tail protein [Anaerovoracaceae bacterium]|uniref:putative phage tail protein n=1 Tax=Chryseobacterium sp. TaxID=1871047 RepID=UPI002FC8D80C
MNNILEKINRLNQNDKLVIGILNAAEINLEDLQKEISKIYQDLFFDSCSLDRLKVYEKEAGIIPADLKLIDNRRAALMAKWRSDGKISNELLQAVADSWSKGKVVIDFIDGKIQVTYTDIFGVPDDKAGVEAALDEIKPAHIPIEFILKYLMLSDVEHMTLEELEKRKLTDFAFE